MQILILRSKLLHFRQSKNTSYLMQEQSSVLRKTNQFERFYYDQQ